MCGTQKKQRQQWPIFFSKSRFAKVLSIHGDDESYPHYHQASDDLDQDRACTAAVVHGLVGVWFAAFFFLFEGESGALHPNHQNECRLFESCWNLVLTLSRFRPPVLGDFADACSADASSVLKNAICL